MEALIQVFQTHIECSNVPEDKRFALLKQFSKYDETTHKYIPITIYELDNVFYVPKGANLNKLANLLETKNVLTLSEGDKSKKIPSYQFIGEAKSIMQQRGMDFLTSENEFVGSDRYPQKALNLDTGDGKTVCVIYNLIKRRMRTMIIVSKEIIKEQWEQSILKFTTMTEDRICILDSNKIKEIIESPKSYSDYDVFIVNHQTISSFAKQYTWKAVYDLFKHLQIGIKVIDEAHEFFRSTFLIDCFSNTVFTIYLTATFSRSDPKEVKLFDKAFKNVYRFGEETLSYKEKRKHIIYIAGVFYSEPTDKDQRYFLTGHGFSKSRYMEYLVNKDQHKKCLATICSVLMKTRHMEGKTLILTSTIASCNAIKDFIKEKTDCEDTIGIVNSTQKGELSTIIENSRVIIATQKSLDTGADIKGLRILINIIPVRSEVIIRQMIGRLREYDRERDTYFFDLHDFAIPRFKDYYTIKLPIVEKKAKEIHVTQF